MPVKPVPSKRDCSAPLAALTVPPPLAARSRQAAALLEILQAGEEVEAVIAARRADIDETTLQVRGITCYAPRLQHCNAVPVPRCM